MPPPPPPPPPSLWDAAGHSSIRNTLFLVITKQANTYHNVYTHTHTHTHTHTLLSHTLSTQIRKMEQNLYYNCDDCQQAALNFANYSKKIRSSVSFYCELYKSEMHLPLLPKESCLNSVKHHHHHQLTVNKTTTKADLFQAPCHEAHIGNPFRFYL